MSALAWMLESRGLPTTVLALVLPQVEKTRPPRAVMTPFLLGRPLGEPNDPGFQRRVLVQALQLLERDDGPVILEHFPDDHPSWFDRPGWTPATVLAEPVLPANADEWAVAWRDELALVLPAWERFKQRFGRTSVGLSGQAVSQWPDFVGAFLAGSLPTVVLHESPGLSLRFLADDIKALYGEAAQADGEPPSAAQLDRFFWQRTLAGQLLIALRTLAMASENNGLKTMGGRFLVPVPHLPKAP